MVNVWLVGVVVHVGFMGLGFWQAVWALVIWPYYLGWRQRDS